VDENVPQTPELEITTSEEVIPLEESSEQQIVEEEIDLIDDSDLDEINLDEEIELLD
jgi:hypothetical protein